MIVKCATRKSLSRITNCPPRDNDFAAKHFDRWYSGRFSLFLIAFIITCDPVPQC